MAVSFVAAGTGAGAVGGSSASIGTPSGFASGDLLVLAVEKTGDYVAPSPWVQMYGGGTGNAGGDAFYKIADGSETTMSISNSSGYNHIFGVMLAFRGGHATTPINVQALASGTGTSGSAVAVTTTVADCMVVNVIFWSQDTATGQSSSQANSNLTSVTEQYDAGTTSGDGGGITIITGFKATAGSTGNTTFTLANSQDRGELTFAIAPLVYKHTVLLCC